MSEDKKINKAREIANSVIGEPSLWGTPMMMIAQGLSYFEGGGFKDIKQEENVLTFTYYVMDYPVLECRATVTIEHEVLRELK